MKKITHSLSISKLSNGNELTLDYVTFDSEKQGPHIYMQANVHGAELQGNLVIKELMQYFEANPFVGKITFVPFANPLGSTQTFGGYTYGRFNPRTGDNWNRNYLDLNKLKEDQVTETLDDFVSRCLEKDTDQITEHYKSFIKKNLTHYLAKSNGYGNTENKKLFVTLQILASEADVILDLHTGSTATRYLYAAEYEKSWAKKMNFPHTLIIPDEFAGAMDEACFTPWITLKEKLEAKHKDYTIPIQSFTLELGSEETVSSYEAQTDALRILGFLKEKGTHSNDLEELETKQYHCPLSQFKSYYAPIGGLCEYLVSPGEAFKKDDKLAVIHNFDKQKFEWISTDIIAQNQGIMINHCATSNIIEGHNLFQIMENPQEF